MDQEKIFGKRVRSARKAAKLTLEEAAEKAGFHPNYLGEIERGEKHPSFEAITGLAKALNVSPAAFFQFDREESDPRVLRKKIEALLDECSHQQLQQAYRVLKSLTEP